ncbi:vWA domain-containing protein [Nocardioides dongxiaopingii]|uniref:vWA domain-containing protein n=1 Tax=Nocardioides sp. S-1144 TaxID=2582905 RepID=UPI0016528F0B|nr:von Willebrand factor type A domain-containing protein [Nocardioides sp. S-1144]
MNPRRATTILAGLGLTSTLVLGACSGGGSDADDGGGRAATAGDPSDYHEDYEVAPREDSGAVPQAVPAPGGAGGRGTDDGPYEPAPDELNEFREAGTNGFVWAGEDPLSTFGLDVDTGSFGVARTLMGDGYPVPPEAVRPEEWINAVPYGDAPPTDADLGLVSETGPSPTMDGAQVVRVGVAAREVDPAERPRVNVTLVVDRSGSMDGRDRLGLVQSSLAVLAEELEDDDTVSVVSFQEEAESILEPTPVRDQDAILDAIEELRPGGGTNLEAGLRLGYEQAREAFDEDAVNVVVICSDGVANIGATGPGSITERIAEEGADGIHLVTVGFGMGSYNDHLMEQVADLGDGFYSYVDTFEEAEQLFGTDLTTTLVPVAAEARAQVAFDPEAVESYRLIGYENRDIADEDFEDLSVDAGELGSGHRATALYEVTLADGVEPGASIGRATVLWRSVESGEPQEAAVELLAADPGAEGDDGTPSDAWQLSTAVADLAQVVKGAEPFAERAVTLEDLQERVDPLLARDVPGAAELAEMVELARSVD